MPKKLNRQKLDKLLMDALDEDEIVAALDLIKKGASLNLAGKKRCPALIVAVRARYASEADRTSWIKDLLAHPEINVNAAPWDGMTCLHSAAHNRMSEAVEALLKRGADINAKDIEGNTPLHLSVLKATVEYPTPEQDQCVQTLLAWKGIDVDAVNDAGETALHRAAKCGNQSAFHFLLDKGADIAKLTGDGKSVLDCAMRSRNQQLVEGIKARMTAKSEMRLLDGMLPEGR